MTSDQTRGPAAPPRVLLPPGPPGRSPVFAAPVLAAAEPGQRRQEGARRGAEAGPAGRAEGAGRGAAGLQPEEVVAGHAEEGALAAEALSGPHERVPCARQAGRPGRDGPDAEQLAELVAEVAAVPRDVDSGVSKCAMPTESDTRG